MKSVFSFNNKIKHLISKFVIYYQISTLFEEDQATAKTMEDKKIQKKANETDIKFQLTRFDIYDKIYFASLKEA